MSTSHPLEFHPLTPDRWDDFLTLFGPQGAHGGCWCMWWRLTHAQFAKQVGDGNRDALKAIVDSGDPPGILAYSDGTPIAWCSLGPRESFAALNRSPRLKKIDNQPVWSITCFYVDKPYRGQGLMQRLIEAAVDYAIERGATIIEAYPVEPRGRLIGYSGYTGLGSAFRRAGFIEVLRRTPNQPIMRLQVSNRAEALTG